MTFQPPYQPSRDASNPRSSHGANRHAERSNPYANPLCSNPPHPPAGWKPALGPDGPPAFPPARCGAIRNHTRAEACATMLRTRTSQPSRSSRRRAGHRTNSSTEIQTTSTKDRTPERKKENGNVNGKVFFTRNRRQTIAAVATIGCVHEHSAPTFGQAERGTAFTYAQSSVRHGYNDGCGNNLACDHAQSIAHATQSRIWRRR